MTARILLICLATLIVNTTLPAQDPIKTRISPMASVSMRHKDAYVRIIYSQPQKNNRVIFGKLVPYGQVWRLGANEATEMITTRDLLINNQVLRAGTYSVFAIPNEDKWTIIINSELGLWGSYNYNARLDVMRFDVPVKVQKNIEEALTFEFIQKNELADLLIYWDNTSVTIPFKFLN